MKNCRSISFYWDNLQIQVVDKKEMKFARKALFSRHHEMRDWPAGIQPHCSKSLFELGLGLVQLLFIFYN